MGNSSTSPRSPGALTNDTGADTINLYNNLNANNALDLVDLETVYEDWQNTMLPEFLRTSFGLSPSYPGLAGPNTSLMLPALVPPDFCSVPRTATLQLKCSLPHTPDLVLHERVLLSQFESELASYFNGLFSLGYRNIYFKVVRPFVEIHHVSNGSPTGGYSQMSSQYPNLAYDPNHDYVKTLYWAIGIQGEVMELVDELTVWKKLVTSGDSPDHVLARMKRLAGNQENQGNNNRSQVVGRGGPGGNANNRDSSVSSSSTSSGSSPGSGQKKTGVPDGLIQRFADWCKDYKKRMNKKGRRSGGEGLQLQWSYQYMHLADQNSSSLIKSKKKIYNGPQVMEYRNQLVAQGKKPNTNNSISSPLGSPGSEESGAESAYGSSSATYSLRDAHTSTSGSSGGGDGGGGGGGGVGNQLGSQGKKGGNYIRYKEKNLSVWEAVTEMRLKLTTKERVEVSIVNNDDENNSESKISRKKSNKSNSGGTNSAAGSPELITRRPSTNPTGRGVQMIRDHAQSQRPDGVSPTSMNTAVNVVELLKKPTNDGSTAGTVKRTSQAILVNSNEITYRDWRPFLCVEKAEAENVREWMHSAHVSLSRGNTQRMAKCLSIASEMLKDLVLRGIESDVSTASSFGTDGDKDKDGGGASAQGGNKNEKGAGGKKGGKKGKGKNGSKNGNKDSDGSEMSGGYGMSVQGVFRALPVEQRELFIVGIKTRLRDLYALLDAGKISKADFASKTSQMAKQIIYFIDNVALPCLSWTDVDVQVDSMREFQEITARLDHRCYVQEEFTFKGETFQPGDYVKRAPLSRNADPRIVGLASNAQIVDAMIEVERQMSSMREQGMMINAGGASSNPSSSPATFVKARENLKTPPKANDTNSSFTTPNRSGGGAGESAAQQSQSDPLIISDLDQEMGLVFTQARIMHGGSQTNDPDDPTDGNDDEEENGGGGGGGGGSGGGGGGNGSGGVTGQYMKFSEFARSTPVPCVLTFAKSTARSSLENISKWVGWKGDWCRYLCLVGYNQSGDSLRENAMIAKFCYYESFRLSSIVMKMSNKVSYESLVTLLNQGVFAASVERNYDKARSLLDRAVRLIDEGESRDDPTLHQPHARILVQNAYRLQRTFYSYVVVLSVTIDDWDVLGLLADCADIDQKRVQQAERSKSAVMTLEDVLEDSGEQDEGVLVESRKISKGFCRNCCSGDANFDDPRGSSPLDLNDTDIDSNNNNNNRGPSHVDVLSIEEHKQMITRKATENFHNEISALEVLDPDQAEALAKGDGRISQFIKKQMNLVERKRSKGSAASSTNINNSPRPNERRPGGSVVDFQGIPANPANVSDSAFPASGSRGQLHLSRRQSRFGEPETAEEKAEREQQEAMAEMEEERKQKVTNKIKHGDQHFNPGRVMQALRTGGQTGTGQSNASNAIGQISNAVNSTTGPGNTGNSNSNGPSSFNPSQQLKTKVRLKVVVRMILWIIRQRHIYALKMWFRTKWMAAAGQKYGIFWLDHAERDQNHPGRRYFLACRVNGLFLRGGGSSTSDLRQPPFDWIGRILLAHHSMNKGDSGPSYNLARPNPNNTSSRCAFEEAQLQRRLGLKQDQGLHQLNEKINTTVVDAESGTASITNSEDCITLSSAFCLGCIPYAEVHHLFTGFDDDIFQPKKIKRKVSNLAGKGPTGPNNQPEQMIAGKSAQSGKITSYSDRQAHKDKLNENINSVMGGSARKHLQTGGVISGIDNKYLRQATAQQSEGGRGGSGGNQSSGGNSSAAAQAEEAFSIQGFLNGSCLDYQCNAYRGRKMESEGKMLRNLSVRRHPMRALKSGPG